ncbi:MAG: SsrA-binding protein SmpB [Candidatus Dadabacteria bacterium]|nr:MAG: SsrA-binding protein SmpB [Candidatus Dadabacteria bacterium]
MGKKKKTSGGPVQIQNRKARHLYQILDTFEAGIVLSGSEVKSLRAGRANLQDAYARIKDGEAWLINAHIAPYDQAGGYGHDDPTRNRKLLLHRREIDRLYGEIKSGGLTLVPLRIYFKNGRAKVELALARGKKSHDKREDLKKRDQKREMERHARGGRVRI